MRSDEMRQNEMITRDDMRWGETRRDGIESGWDGIKRNSPVDGNGGPQPSRPFNKLCSLTGGWQALFWRLCGGVCT
eukprot:scaffold335992_cov17-Prasinocladus_malaysianus.AAC.1